MAATLTFGRNNGKEEVASPVMKPNTLIVKNKCVPCEHSRCGLGWAITLIERRGLVTAIMAKGCH